MLPRGGAVAGGDAAWLGQAWSSGRSGLTPQKDPKLFPGRGNNLPGGEVWPLSKMWSSFSQGEHVGERRDRLHLAERCTCPQAALAGAQDRDASELPRSGAPTRAGCAPSPSAVGFS